MKRRRQTSKCNLMCRSHGASRVSYELGCYAKLFQKESGPDCLTERAEGLQRSTVARKEDCCLALRASFAPIRSFELGLPESVLSISRRRSSSASRSSSLRRSSRSASSPVRRPRSPRPSPPPWPSAARWQREALRRHRARAHRARVAGSHTPPPPRKQANAETSEPQHG